MLLSNGSFAAPGRTRDSDIFSKSEDVPTSINYTGIPTRRDHEVIEEALPFPLGWVLLTGIVLAGTIIPLLVAINWRRLGYPGRTLPTLLIGYFGLPLGSLAIAHGSQALMSSASSPYLSSIVTAVVPATLIYGGLLLWQLRPYQEWREQTHYSPKFGRIGCVGYLFIAGFLSSLSIGAVQSTYAIVTSSLTTPYYSNSLSFNYPSIWTLDDSSSACGETPAVYRCVARLTAPGVAVIVLKKTSSSLSSISTTAAAAAEWEGGFGSDAIHLDQTSTEVRSGYDAVWYSGTFTRRYGNLESGSKASLLLIRTLPHQFILLMTIYDPLAESAVQGMIDTIQIDPVEE